MSPQNPLSLNKTRSQHHQDTQLAILMTSLLYVSSLRTVVVRRGVGYVKMLMVTAFFAGGSGLHAKPSKQQQQLQEALEDWAAIRLV